MSNAIQIKRRASGGSAGAPLASALKWGELAFNEADDILYYGWGSGNDQASSVYQIGGSGYFAHRGGTNASGLWPIAITGNAATASTSDQVKTQSASSDASYYLTFVDANNGSATSETIYTDAGVSYNPSSNTLSAGIIATTGNITVGGDLIVNGTTTTVNSTEVEIGDNIITVNASGLATGGFRVKDSSDNYQSLIWSETNHQWEFQGDTANIYTSGEITLKATSTSSIGWIPVFDGAGAPDSTPNAIQYITRSNFLSDLGIASSGTQIIAGNGLTGGGTLEADRTLNVGAGDGISVTADAVAVDSTVVRTTGNQTIGGVKTFSSTISGSIDGNAATVTNGVYTNTTQTITGTKTFNSDAQLILTDGSTLLINDGAADNSSSSYLLDIQYQGTLDGLKISNDSSLLVQVGDSGDGSDDITIQTGDDLTISAGGTLTLGTIDSATWNGTTIGTAYGGTGQTTYTNGQLLIGNTTGNTLTKATLTAGTDISITNGTGSITIAHSDTSTLTGAQGSNGISSITVDGNGHVTAVSTATYLTAGTVCAAIASCTIDGGTF